MSEEPNGESDAKSDGERYIELIERLEELEATPVERRLRNLQTSFYVAQRNFEQMMQALVFYQESDDIWDMRNRPALDEFQQEFLRLTHNYIASYFSLYQHTQRIKNHIDRENFVETYQTKLDETDIEEISRFLLRFRAYTQHYELPPLVATFEYETTDRETGEGVERRRLVFDREKLLEWDDWGKSRSFVEGFDEHVDFLEVAEEYQEKIREFTEWFDEAVRTELSDEFDEHNSVVSELQEISHRLIDDETLEAWGIDTAE